MTASGTAGHGAELAGSFDLASVGALVAKSLAAFEWDGNPAPRLHPTAQGMLNAVGLQGPGIEHWLDHDRARRSWRRGATVVASIWGRSVDDYRAAAELLAAAPAQRRRRRGQPVVPEPRGSAVDLRPRPELSAAVIEATAGVWPAPLGEAERQHRPDRRGRRRPWHGAGAEAVTLHQHAARHGDRPRARDVRRSAAGGGGLSGRADPSGRRARRARRARGAPRPADRRRRRRGQRVGRRRAAARRGVERCRSAPPRSPTRRPPSDVAATSWPSVDRTRAGHSRHRCTIGRASVTAWQHLLS